MPRKVAVSPRPVEGSQPSMTANTMMSMSPTQKVGRLKPRIEPAMTVLRDRAFGLQPGVEAERDADQRSP